jgi:hypothetical protein
MPKVNLDKLKYITNNFNKIGVFNLIGFDDIIYKLSFKFYFFTHGVGITTYPIFIKNGNTEVKNQNNIRLF